MAKTPLIERMEKKSAPKSWIAAVRSLHVTIKGLRRLNNEYLDIVDILACEKEQLEAELAEKEKSVIAWMRLYWEWLDKAATLEAENECLETELDNVRDTHEELEAENEALSELLSSLVDVELERDKYAALLRTTTCLGCMLNMLECKCEEQDDEAE